VEDTVREWQPLSFCLHDPEPFPRNPQGTGPAEFHADGRAVCSHRLAELQETAIAAANIQYPARRWRLHPTGE